MNRTFRILSAICAVFWAALFIAVVTGTYTLDRSDMAYATLNSALFFVIVTLGGMFNER